MERGHKRLFGTITFSTILLLMSFVLIQDPSFSGFVTQPNYQTSIINLETDKTGNYELNLPLSENQLVTSLSITGHLHGKGNTRIYLNCGANTKQQQLIYSSTRPAPPNTITGYYINTPEEINTDNTITPFTNVCDETCVLYNLPPCEYYSLNIDATKDINIHIARITYSTTE